MEESWPGPLDPRLVHHLSADLHFAPSLLASTVAVLTIRVNPHHPGRPRICNSFSERNRDPRPYEGGSFLVTAGMGGLAVGRSMLSDNRVTRLIANILLFSPLVIQQLTPSSSSSPSSPECIQQPWLPRTSCFHEDGHLKGINRLQGQRARPHCSKYPLGGPSKRGLSTLPPLTGLLFAGCAL